MYRCITAKGGVFIPVANLLLTLEFNLTVTGGRGVLGVYCASLSQRTCYDLLFYEARFRHRRAEY